MRTIFGPWKPDYGSKTDGLVTCKNTIPLNSMYMPFYDLNQYSTNAVTGTPKQLINVVTSSFDVRTFVPVNDKIFRLNGSVGFDDVSKVGGYNQIDPHVWDWALYGNTLICSTYTDPIQALTDITTSTNFANLTSASIYAKTICMYKDHLFLGNVKEGSTAYERRVWRSAKGDITTFTASPSTGSGFQDIPAFNQFMVALRPMSDWLLAYMSNSLWVIDFVGAPYWFSYTKINEGPAPLSPHAIAMIDENRHVYIASDDIYMVEKGIVTGIGDGIKRSVLGNMDQSKYFRITNCIDFRNSLVYWSYVSTDSPDGFPDKLLAFNWKEGRFSTIDLHAYCLGNIIKYTASTISQITTYISNESSIIDSGGLSSTDTIIAAVNDSKYLATFNGTVLTSTLRTGEFVNEGVVMSQHIRPIIESPQGTVQGTLFVRDSDVDNYRNRTATMRSNGLLDIRLSGRQGQFQLDVSGVHSGIIGFDVEGKMTGRR